ncbi:MAG TPA: ribose-phosphate diphosphokinase [Spirochaetia bacterium]|nr:ribose-phosphate diphosphokinase [Spirochaetia bacterium]
MADVSLSQIGILPCPGGLAFAQKIFGHLETITREKLEERVAMLSKSYKLPRAEIIRQVNLSNDILPSSGDLDEPIDRQRSPTYLVPAKFTRFPNGEFKTEILTSVRDTEIYIVQDVSNRYPLQFQKTDDPQCLSVNDHLFCLLVTVDAALQAGAMQVTVILPTFPYSRQHKKKGRESLSAARVGQMLEAFGVTRIITLDIHSKEIENCFNHVRLENLHGAYQIIKALASVTDLKDEKLVVVAPDTGAVDRNKFYASILGKPLGMLYKERDYSRVAQSAEKGNITDMKLLGSVEGKTVFMIDDMIGTGGTLIKAMRKLKEFGAEETFCAVSLPLFSAEAVDTFDAAYAEGLFSRIIGTNAVYHDESVLNREWYLSADVTQLFARIIYRLHYNRSLSSLLDDRSVIKDLLKRS